jgi:hypothetical protein
VRRRSESDPTSTQDVEEPTSLTSAKRDAGPTRRGTVSGRCKILSWDVVEGGRTRFEMGPSAEYAGLVRHPSSAVSKRTQSDPVVLMDSDAVGPDSAKSPKARLSTFPQCSSTLGVAMGHPPARERSGPTVTQEPTQAFPRLKVVVHGLDVGVLVGGQGAKIDDVGADVHFRVATGR